MRTLLGALLTLTALTPALLVPAAATAQLRGDAGIQPQAEDRVEMGSPGRPRFYDGGDRPRPDRTGFGGDRADRGADGGWRDDRASRPAGDTPRPDRTPGQDWQSSRPDRTPRQDWQGNSPDRGGYDRPRPAARRDDRRHDDWTRSRLDRRDQWWAQSRFEDRAAWNRGWRTDRRYDWNRYRAQDRSAYRLPRYYTPYGWGGGYRRFGVGVSLQSALWGRNYWIADPYAYRLPDAYGPYRWVRYYDDALLVDLRSGLVVDAVYGIFW